MADYRENDAFISGYEGHILFDNAESREKAEWLAAATSRRFGIAMSAPSAAPVPPLPRRAISFTVAPDRFAEIAPFMAMNRNGLFLVFRPVTGDARADYTDHLICTYDDVPLEVDRLPGKGGGR